MLRSLIKEQEKRKIKERARKLRYWNKNKEKFLAERRSQYSLNS